MIKGIFKKILSILFNIILPQESTEDRKLRIRKITQYLKFFYLRIKYLRLKKIFTMPTRHVLCLDIYVKVQRVLDKENITHFLHKGCMLGAYRQGAFAGRPGDIDLMILDKDFEKLISLKDEFDKNLKLGVARNEDVTKKKFTMYKEDFLFRANDILVDIAILHKPNENNNKWHFKNPALVNKIEYENIDIINPKKIKIYDYVLAPVPSNVEKYLTVIFGNQWRDTSKTNEYSKNFIFH